MKKQNLLSLLIIAIGMALIQSCQLKRIDPPCPTVSSISPEAARFDETVTIHGDNFLTGIPELYQISIGDKTVPTGNIEVPDANTLRFKVPKGIGSGPVTVTLNGLPNCNSIPKIFTYYYTATMVSKLMDGLNSPAGLDVDTTGNVVVADRNNRLIKVIKPATDPSGMGQIIKIHGNGSNDCNPTPVSSENASFSFPVDIDIDIKGDIYIPEESNAVIRRITSTGSVEVFVGSCGATPPIDYLNSGPRGSARLNAPMSFANEGTNLYFTDAGNIRKIDASDKVTTLLRPNGNDFFRGIEISRSRSGTGHIFVINDNGSTTNPVTIKSVDDGGAARNIEFAPNSLSHPVAMAIDGKGNIFVADKGNHHVFVIYTNGVLLSLAGTGESGYAEGMPGATAKFDQLTGIALNEKKGTVYVSDSKNKVVRTIRIE